MANNTLTGNDAANGATLTNATDGSGTPLKDPTRVTVNKTSNVTVSQSNNNGFYDVNFLAGNDTLIATNMPWVNASGDDVGFDEIYMGDGNDFVEMNRSAFRTTLDMGSGADTLFMNNSGGTDANMGSGDDLARVDMSGEVSEEEAAQKAGQNPLALEGGTGIDTLNLMGDWTLTLSSGNATLDTDGNGSGDLVTNSFSSDQFNQVIGMPSLLSGTVQWGGVRTLSGGDTVVNQTRFSNFEDLNAVCFAAGTMIDVPGGQTPVDQLKIGDLVLTHDGPKRVSWAGKKSLDVIDLMANPKLLPIRIAAGSFAEGLPRKDVLFSPQHRLLLRSPIAERMFGSKEVLAAAKHLIGFNGIDVDGDVRQITYCHIMVDRHTVLRTEGIEAETLFPGPVALNYLSNDDRAEIEEIFPDCFGSPKDQRQTESAFLMLKGRDCRSLVARHRKNNKPIYQSDRQADDEMMVGLSNAYNRSPTFGGATV